MGNELEWQLVPGGLCGSAEFSREILQSREELARYTVYGKLGLNDLGRKEVLCFVLLTSSLLDQLNDNLNAAHLLIRLRMKNAKKRSRGCLKQDGFVPKE